MSPIPPKFESQICDAQPDELGLEKTNLQPAWITLVSFFIGLGQVGFYKLVDLMNNPKIGRPNFKFKLLKKKKYDHRSNQPIEIEPIIIGWFGFFQQILA